jgi:hypothetical protein
MSGRPERSGPAGDSSNAPGLTRMQGDAISATVELRSTNLDQLSKRRVKLNRIIERRHRAIGVERRGLQIDAFSIGSQAIHPTTRKAPRAFRRSNPGQGANKVRTSPHHSTTSPRQPRRESLAIEPNRPTQRHPTTPSGTNRNPRVGDSSPSSGILECPATTTVFSVSGLADKRQSFPRSFHRGRQGARRLQLLGAADGCVRIHPS